MNLRDLIDRHRRAANDRLVYSAEFEREHPRDEAGEFTNKASPGYEIGDKIEWRQFGNWVPGIIYAVGINSDGEEEYIIEYTNRPPGERPHQNVTGSKSARLIRRAGHA